jgi:hypothetical protein
MFSSFLSLSQPLAAATRSRGRRAHAMATSALAVLAVAGGVALSGGEAKAFTCASWPPSLPSTPCTDGNFTLVPLTGPSSGAGDLELEQYGISPDEVKVDIDYTPLLIGIDNFVYSLTHNLSEKFINAKLTLAVPIGEIGSATKTVYGSYDPNTGTLSNLIGTLNVNEIMPTQTISLSQQYSTIYVRDSYSGTEIDNVINSYQTPGPLPILGAGAAFGFSRKLRVRIKGSRAA